MRRLFSIAVLWLICAGSTMAANYQKAVFDKIVDDYFTTYFTFHPVSATAAGAHQYDPMLDQLTPALIQEESKQYTELLSRLKNLPLEQLNPVIKADQEWLSNIVKARLLDLNDIRMWQKDPDLYSSIAVQSVFSLVNRNFAPKEQRLLSIIARENKIPQLLMQARSNLQNPPKIYTQIALEQIPGSIQFFERDLPPLFAEIKNADLLNKFKQSNALTVNSLKEYEVWLQKQLLPRSSGDFRLGAENFHKKLLFEELVDTPLPQLLAIGFADLRKNQAALKQLAQQIDPHKTPRAVLTDLGHDHPKPDILLKTFKTTMLAARRFVETHHIVGVPSQNLPIIAETPPFARALSFASLEVPGPLEKKSKASYFYVTLPEQNWPAKRVEEHMAAFNRETIFITAIHEAFPGHYLQYLWEPFFPSKLRRMIYATSNVEGWAHYTEQMMVDAGYQNNDLNMRLGQIQDALLRNARYIVGIKMHTGEMTYQQGIDFFMKEGYQTFANAEREVKRGTMDPTYLVYTLGKLQIMQLRQDYQQLRGEQFKLQDFHDAFLRQGYAPIKLIRQALLTS